MKKLIANIIKRLYYFIPSKKLKRKIRNKIYFSNRLANIFMYDEKHHQGYKFNSVYTEQVHYYEKKLAVNINIDDNKYLGNIISLLKVLPYEFDVYLNCPNTTNTKKFEKSLRKNMYLNNIYIKNKTDIFLKTSLSLTEINLENYEYILNLNTCAADFKIEKLDEIVNTKYLLKNLMYFFKNTNTKIINFLTDEKEHVCNNSKLISKVVETLEHNDIKFNDYNFSDFSKYIISSVSLLDTDLIKMVNYNSFNDSNINVDCLDYTFQKILKLIFDKNNYMCLEFDFEQNKFIELKIKKTTCKMDKDKLLKILNEYDIVSFDIFDTLITRRIYNPDDLFRLLDIKLKNKYKYIGNFIDIRKKAEMQANKKLKKDVNIDEIYKEFGNITKLNKESVEKIKQEEINLEFDMIIPRKEMVDIYNQLIKNNKKIFLLTDMYMSKKVIEQILVKLKIKGYDKLWVSCDINCRKDTGKIWEKLKSEYPNENIIHIGDNNNSDIKQALLHDVSAFKIYSGKEISQKLLGVTIKSLDESIIYGNIFNTYLFNSPFIFYSEIPLIEDCYQYGCVGLVPIFIYFFSWLVNLLKENQNQHLLFVSRDGYYLEKIYKYIIEQYDDLKKIKYDYFLTSRRASSIACAKTKEDLFEILDTQYEGTLKDLFNYRFGVQLNIENRSIKLPNDIEYVKNIISNNRNIFLNNAKEERENYLKYIEKIKKDVKDDELTFIDLGYSGTAQYYISKLLNKRTNGIYFLTSENIKPLKLNCHVECCFNADNKKGDISNPLYQNTLLLESFLTAPYGQLNKFEKKDGTIIPNYTSVKIDKNVQIKLDIILKSILDSFEFFFNLGLNFTEIKMNKNNIYKVYQYATKNLKQLNNEILDIFNVEDFYCCNGVINALEI